MSTVSCLRRSGGVNPAARNVMSYYRPVPIQVLIELARQGDEHAMECLIREFEGLVRSKARRYVHPGAEEDDIVQEGLIGLYKAIRDFRIGNPSFWAFAQLYITRQIIAAVRMMARRKHVPLNSYVPLDMLMYGEDSERALVDMIPCSRSSDHEEVVITREALRATVAAFREHLSELEKQVIIGYLQGKSYRQMATELQCDVKRISNALQRARMKLRARI